MEIRNIDDQPDIMSKGWLCYKDHPFRSYKVWVISNEDEEMKAVFIYNEVRDETYLSLHGKGLLKQHSEYRKLDKYKGWTRRL